MTENSREEPNDTDARRRARDQIRLILEASKGRIDWHSDEEPRSRDEADFTFICDADHVLVRDENVDALRGALERLQDDFDGVGDRVGSPIDGLTRYLLPPRRDDRPRTVPETLDRIDDVVGRPGLATPDHFIHVTPTSTCCPATEPEETGLPGPWPPPAGDPDAGLGTRVSVVDTGWHPPAEAHPATPWLTGVVGDDEQNNPAALRPYAGHGTFIAGVVRCIAPRAGVRVEGFPVDAVTGVLESDMVAQLTEALAFDPHVINLSAGSRTRLDLPMVSFEVFWDTILSKRPNTVLVAAAGNDSTDAPFYPAAFDWAVGVGSLDLDHRVSSFSNYGVSADVFALGRNIVNAFPEGRFVCHETPDKGDVRQFTTGLARWSGTSFAAPIVAGMIAARISAAAASAEDARNDILGQATPLNDPLRGPIQALLPSYT